MQTNGTPGPPAQLTTRQLVAELHRLVAERARLVDELKRLVQRPI